MTRLITKRMRDSFKVSLDTKIKKHAQLDCVGTRWRAVYHYFNSTKKQRILILKGTIK